MNIPLNSTINPTLDNQSLNFSSLANTQMSSSPSEITISNIYSNKYIPHINDNKTLNTYHKQIESKILIKKYGSDILTILNKYDKHFPLNFLSTNSYLSTYDRIDILIHMLDSFKHTNAYFLAVNIIDNFIYKCKLPIYNNEIHLISICAIHLASKMVDTVPLSTSYVLNKLGEGKYQRKDIINKEREILLTINFELLISTTYDYIEAFLYDFKVNNELFVRNYMKYDFNLFKGICLFLCKLATFSKEFSCYYQETIAKCIIVLGYDLYRKIKKDNMNEKVNVNLYNWITFILKQNISNKYHYKQIYDKLVQIYDINIRGGFGNGIQFKIEYEDI